VPLAAALLAALPGLAHGATTVPTDVQLPGTQPGQVSQIQSVSKCDNCHGNLDPAGGPWFNWSGSMMAHASRDPIFWATVAIAEQDFDGSGGSLHPLPRGRGLARGTLHSHRRLGPHRR
jgi:hypothetical protein